VFIVQILSYACCFSVPLKSLFNQEKMYQTWEIREKSGDLVQGIRFVGNPSYVEWFLTDMAISNPQVTPETF